MFSKGIEREQWHEPPVPESLFDKVASLRSATLLKKRLWRRCFPVNFAKYLRTPFLQNTSQDDSFCLFLVLESAKIEWRES